MKLRIGVWILVGLFIATFWAVYASAVGPVTLLSQRTLLSFARLTCPALLLADRMHIGMSLSWTLISNAFIYGWLGAIVEITRRQLRHAL